MSWNLKLFGTIAETRQYSKLKDTGLFYAISTKSSLLRRKRLSHTGAFQAIPLLSQVVRSTLPSVECGLCEIWMPMHWEGNVKMPEMHAERFSMGEGGYHPMKFSYQTCLSPNFDRHRKLGFLFLRRACIRVCEMFFDV